ncbi:MAG: CarD family transcriptional regulator [Clostridia bacterium]|nr:CarD family transcriptional regulator [Clostridia bacterium]
MKVGTLLSYGTSGVCKVIDVRKETVLGKTVEYYVLSPVNDEKTTIFIPTNNERLVAKMQPLLTPDEINELIASMPHEVCEWIAEDRVRNETFREYLNNGTRNDLVRMMRILYTHRGELAKCGKKLRTSDSLMLRQAESKLYGEIALVLGIDVSEVEGYIEQRLKA